MSKISQFDNAALAVINRALDEVDSLKKQILRLESRLGQVDTKATTAKTQNEPTTRNNLVFSWDGATLKLSWGQGYIQDKNNKLIPVAAGSSSVLSVSTGYWIGYNKNHNQMLFVTNYEDIFLNPDSVSVAFVTTGSAIDPPTDAGGGGLDGSGGGLSGGRYDYF